MKISPILNSINKIQNLSHIEMLCCVFECEPIHLYVYEGDTEVGQPVTELRTLTVLNMQELAKGVSMVRLEEIRRKIEEMKWELK